MAVTEHYFRRVPPFGYPRIYACLRLPVAFRSLPRPSSAISALASTLRSYSLDLFRNLRSLLRLLSRFGRSGSARCASGFRLPLHVPFCFGFSFSVQFSRCARPHLSQKGPSSGKTLKAIQKSLERTILFAGLPPALRLFAGSSFFRLRLSASPTSTSGSEKCFHLSALPRKEVIQPHLPIRLPCYDFTPVIGLTLDGCSLR